MTVRDLMRKLLDMNPDGQLLIDAAGRGTYEIADILKAGSTTIVITDAQLYERSSVHDADDTIQQLTGREG